MYCSALFCDKNISSPAIRIPEQFNQIIRFLIISMGIFGFFFSAFARADTYTDPAFTFKYPKGWSKLQNSTPDRLVFRDGTGRVQLTVSVMNYNSSITGQALRDAFDRLLQHRMDAEKVGLGKTDSLESLATEGIPGGYQARFQGYESLLSRRFIGVLFMSRGYVLVFYLEGLNITEPELKNFSDGIFPSIKLRQTTDTPDVQSK